jgi:hemoglobin
MHLIGSATGYQRLMTPPQSRVSTNMHSQTRTLSRDLIIEDIVARTGIGEAMIERLVRAFYGRARRDPFIGPIFESKVSDWEDHIARLCAFWSSVALMSGRYHGQPMAAHLPLPIDTPHFDRWLEIFAETARELCPPAAAAHFLERAQRIADSLELGIAAHKGEIRAKRIRPTQALTPAQDKARAQQARR